MAKVMVGGKDGQALQAEGKSNVEVFKDEKRPARESAPALEMKAGDGVSPPLVDGPGERIEAKVEEPDEHIDPEDRDLSDIAIKEAQDKARRKIGKYAQRWQTELKAKERLAEEAADAERFAEQLFNEREAYRKRVAELEAIIPKDQPKEPEFKAPDENDPKYRNAAGEFEWKKFSTDNAAYEAKKAIAEDRKARAEEENRARAEAEAKKFKERIEAAEKKYPDWQKKVAASPVILPNEALAFIRESDYGTDIAYYLAENPVEAEKIKALHPIRAIAAIRDIEAGFEKPKQPLAEAPAAPSKTVERQGAPAPITPIVSSGSTPIPVDPAKMNFRQLREYERERARKMR